VRSLWSRRCARGAIALGLVVTVVVSLVVGCGGSLAPTFPSPDGGAGIKVAGNVVLPEGSGLHLSGLRVMGCLGQSRVTEKGEFSVTQPDTGPAQVMLLDSAGKVVLLGYVDAAYPEAGEISAKETAVALLFDCLLPFIPSAEYYQTVLDLIRKDPLAETLGSAIASAVAANPTALADGDPQILSALDSAVATLRSQASARAAAKARASAVGLAANGAGISLVTDIAPSVQQSGLQFMRSATTDGVTFLNSFRRHCGWHAFATGYVDASDQEHDLIPSEPVAPGTIRYVPATTGLNGVIGTLADLVMGIVAFAPVYCDPFDLPAYSSDAKETYYSVFAVGPSGMGRNTEQVLAAYDRIPAGERADMLTTEQVYSGVTFFLDMLLPFIFSVIPADSIVKAYSAGDAVEVSYEAYKFLIKSLPAVTAELADDDYAGALNVCLRNMSTSPIILKGLLDVLVKKGLLNISTGLLAEGIAKKMAIYVVIADAVLALFDIGTVVHDMMQSEPVESWTATATRPTVRISPDPINVSPGDKALVRCVGVSGVEGDLVYVWSTAGRSGELEDDRGHSGTAFESSEPAVRYVCDWAADDGDTDTVKVSAYVKRWDGRKLLGDATASGEVKDKRPGGTTARTQEKIWYLWWSGIGPPFRCIGGAQVVAIWSGTAESYDYVLRRPGRADEEGVLAAADLWTAAELQELWWYNVYQLQGGQVAYVFGGKTDNGWGELWWFNAREALLDQNGRKEPSLWPKDMPEWADWLTWELEVWPR